MSFDPIELVLKFTLGETTFKDGLPLRAKLHVDASLNREPFVAGEAQLIPWAKLSERDHPLRDIATLLFPGRIRELLHRAMADCADEGSWLRVVLEFQPYAERNHDSWMWMIEMPWEQVHLAPKASDTALPLTFWEGGQPKVSIVRTMAQAFNESRGLRAGKSSTYLHVNATNGALKATTADLDTARFNVETTPLQFTKKKLSKLLDERYGTNLAVLHLTGHGSPGRIPVPGNGVLEPAEFAQMVEGTDVRLLLLSVCHSGSGTGSDMQPGGVVAQLERLGLPAFIGMQESISTDANKVFVTALFATLASGESIDEAVWRGRKALLDRQGDGPHGWSVPVVYLSAVARADPHLWESPSAQPSAGRAAGLKWASAVRNIADKSDEARFLDRGARGTVFPVGGGELGVDPDLVRVAPDATVIGCIHRGQLQISWLSQLGTPRPWPTLDMKTFTDDPADTRLLAVAKKGATSVHCLLSDDSSTYLIRVRRDTGRNAPGETVRRISDKPAADGVLWRERALLVLAGADGARTSEGFPRMSDIWALDATHAPGALHVAALGLDDNGVLAVHVNGRAGRFDIPEEASAIGLIHEPRPAPSSAAVASLAVLVGGALALHDVQVSDQWSVDEGWL